MVKHETDSGTYFVQGEDADGRQFTGDFHTDLTEAIADAKEQIDEEPRMMRVYVWDVELGNEWFDRRPRTDIDPVWFRDRDLEG
jgi:hypothetical protein